MSENKPTIHAALSEVMRDVGAVRKQERNTHQNFVFRGIDTVVKAVYPALLKHGVVVLPTVVDVDFSTVEVGAKRTPMGHCRVTVTYTFYGPAGDSIAATVVAESMDSGDKATAKAMSVAFRTALLQALCLPTDEPDPDSHSYERSPAQKAEPLPQKAAKLSIPPSGKIIEDLAVLSADNGMDLETFSSKWRSQRNLDMDEFLALPADTLHPFYQSALAYSRQQRTSKEG